MKKGLFAVAACLAAVTSLITLGGCAQNLQDTGNKIVSNAKSYFESEINYSGDLSKLKDGAVSYFNEELGLNNNANSSIEGTWKSVQGANDWRWTFDGKNKCLLASKSENSSSEGTYSMDEAKKTVDICLNSWQSTITFSYKLRQTLSDQYLELDSDSQGYSLIREKTE